MKIAVIGHLKFPIRKPFAGGLEAYTHSFIQELASRSNQVTLFAAGGSDPSLPVVPIVQRGTVEASQDRFGMKDDVWIETEEDEAYYALMDRLRSADFDIVHNHSLNPIPLRMSQDLPCPMVTTLHAPCLPRLEREIYRSGAENVGTMVNISQANQQAWSHVIPDQRVVYNGVDTEFWKNCCEDTCDRAIWFGRILPDKGTHLAIKAAHRAGMPIDVVGPISDETYFATEVLPRLRVTDEYHGHQPHEKLCGLISRSAVAVITPCWDEPFGLVVAEALACGTPVAAFERGAIAELVQSQVGSLAEPSDTWGLARAIQSARVLCGDECRRYAEAHFSLASMMQQYLDLYQQLIERWTVPTIPILPTGAPFAASTAARNSLPTMRAS